MRNQVGEVMLSSLDFKFAVVKAMGTFQSDHLFCTLERNCVEISLKEKGFL